jgi:hypothetical protein
MTRGGRLTAVEGSLTTIVINANNPCEPQPNKGWGFDLYAGIFGAGEVTQITPSGAQTTFATGISEARFVIDPTPEPGSGVLMLLCLPALLLYRGHRKVIA